MKDDASEATQPLTSSSSGVTDFLDVPGRLYHYNILYVLFLPARASEQGNVIGSVHIPWLNVVPAENV